MGNVGSVENDRCKKPETQSSIQIVEFTPTISIALDFGTDGLSISYLVNGEIIIQDNWKSRQYCDGVVQKTAILIDNDGTVNKFGQDAIDYYLRLPSKQNNWMLFKEFITDLYGK